MKYWNPGLFTPLPLSTLFLCYHLLPTWSWEGGGVGFLRVAQRLFEEGKLSAGLEKTQSNRFQFCL